MRWLCALGMVVLAGLCVSVFTTGCGSGSANSEVNTNQIPALKPGEAADIKDRLKELRK